MLKSLSLRNARRQFHEYSLYIITLSCSAAAMYAFNALIFSDSVKALSGLDILPYMIIASSSLIVLVMGWIVSYMTNYILKKRSREFSIYLLSGIPSRSVSSLVFFENILVGSLAFLLGLPAGLLLSQLLEAVLLHMFGVEYILHFDFSVSAAALTLLCFSLMLLYSLWKNGRWIRRRKLIDLLLLDRRNENLPLPKAWSSVAVFCLSIFLGCAGSLLMAKQPLGEGYDVLIGIIFLSLFLFGFFLSIPGFLAARFGNRVSWKYRKNRLVPFRGFTAKIQSASIAMGMLSVLLMLSITFMGTGTVINMIASKNLELSVFDIMILHSGELPDFDSCEALLRPGFPIRASHSYGLYTDTREEFSSVRDNAAEESGRYGLPSFAEFDYDTCIRQSDYQKLRAMLWYEAKNLNPSCCYIHCVPALEENFKAFIKQKEQLKCAGYSFAADGVFSEPFSQTEAYGNGLDYVIVVPDQAVSQMKLVYGLYAAITEAPLSNHDVQKILYNGRDLKLLQRNQMKSVPGSSAPTALTENVNYLSGKWAEKELLSQLYAMSICLFYLALILEITGAAILATQVLSDREQKRRQDCILQQIGMTEKHIAKLNNRKLTFLFLLPLLPSLVVSGSLVYAGAQKIQASAFRLPAFTDSFWIIQAFGISLICFLLLYGVYYGAARISYGRDPGMK